MTVKVLAYRFWCRRLLFCFYSFVYHLKSEHPQPKATTHPQLVLLLAFLCTQSWTPKSTSIACFSFLSSRHHRVKCIQNIKSLIISTFPIQGFKISRSWSYVYREWSHSTSISHRLLFLERENQFASIYHHFTITPKPSSQHGLSWANKLGMGPVKKCGWHLVHCQLLWSSLLTLFTQQRS